MNLYKNKLNIFLKLKERRDFMPILTFRAVESEDIIKISKELIDELEALIKCPRDYFTIEVRNSTFIKDGVVDKWYPIIDVAWFDRGQEVQDKVAYIITNHLKNVGYDNVDVIFHKLIEKDYYENGEHF